MSPRKIIFVGGIHGVGKGTFCKKLSDQFKIEHLSASEILKWEDISDLKNKRVLNFSTTQDRLIHNLKCIIKPNKKYLLDGHFTLLNSNGDPEKIDDETFIKINPLSIILLTSDPEIILNRIQQRDNSTYELRTLDSMQQMEIEHATYISEKLNIPLFHVTEGKTRSILEYIKQL